MNRALIGPIFLHQVMVAQHFAVIAGKNDIGVAVHQRFCQQTADLAVHKGNIAIITGIEPPLILFTERVVPGHGISAACRGNIPLREIGIVQISTGVIGVIIVNRGIMGTVGSIITHK